MITKAEGEGYRGDSLPLSPPLAHFNTQAVQEAEAALLTACGSRAWAQAVAAARPYASPEALLTQASAAWFALPEPAWLEAFARHPRIGERRAATTDFLAHSTNEQAQAQQTLDSVVDQLLTLNQQYEQRFGFLYIVFASGRTAPELFKVLIERLRNTREQELDEAARQQNRITQLRLERWLHS